MARPQKKGLSYFPFDVDFFADRKIKILFSNFGAEGVVIYLYFLCEIYKDKGYYLAFDEEVADFFCSELKITREFLFDFINFSTRRNLFDKKLWEKYRVIASLTTQERYQKAKEAAGRKTPITVYPEFWLLPKEETLSYITPVEKGSVKGLNFTDDNVSDFKASEDFLDNSGGKNAQRKENEIKINEIKGDNAREKFCAEIENYFNNNPPNIKNEVLRFIADGVPEDLIRYGFSEAVRLNKPFSYMSAVITQRFNEKRFDYKSKKKSNATYDIEAFKRLGLRVPKL